MRKLTLYRDDSTTQVVFENVKHFFWTAGNTVLVMLFIPTPKRAITISTFTGPVKGSVGSKIDHNRHDP